MKTVLFSQRVEVIESYQERRDCADQRISDFICTCGYLPIPVPNNPSLIGDYIRTLKPCGIILTGGNSLVRYGGNAAEKDATDKQLMDFAIKEMVPLYGFCRGMQSILDYFKCNLIPVAGHAAVRHEVFGSLGNYEVNSYHNQGCTVLNPDCGLRVTALAPDGVIEAVKHETYPIIATMWHPERESPYTSQSIITLKSLFDHYGG